MISSVLAEMDFIEELRLRRWARENYVPQNQRQAGWHPVVHEEMTKRDVEQSEADLIPAYAVPKR
jgi:hypothetical protein